MYAVIKTGGKQYRVAEQDVIRVERLDAGIGESLEIEEVLLVGGDGEPRVGSPFVEGAKVTATLVDQIKGEKVIIFKKRRRKNFRRKRGHRQALSVLRIDGIAA